jgi:hypothetical protein
VFDFSSEKELWAEEVLPVSMIVYNTASQYRNELIGEHQLDLKGVYDVKGSRLFLFSYFILF